MTANITDMPPMNEAETDLWVGGIIQNELQRAEGNGGDELQANRELALDYYFCRPRGDEQKNRSQVISADVADMINATLAMLVPMLSTDCAVEFEPNSEQDEINSKAESDVVNDLIMEQNNGFIQIQSAIKDALLLKNGCMKVSIKEHVDVRTYDVAGVPDEQIAALALSAQPNQSLSLNNGTLKVTTVTREFVVMAVPIENISYRAGWIGKLKDVPFYAERIRYTRSDLVDMGVDRTLVDSLSMSGDGYTGPQLARLDTASDANTAETSDQDIITCHECYIMLDLDGDGISERHRVLVADNSTVLQRNEDDLLPYSMGSPYLNPHQLTGESLFDHLRQTQDVKTSYQRQLIDNVQTIINGRYVYNPAQCTEEDILTPVAGGGIRADSPDAVLPLLIPDVTSGLLQGLAYEDQRRSERGGASLDMMNANAQMVGETAHGIERQMASREQTASMMAANLAETLVRDIYKITHEYLRRYSNAPTMVRVAGQYLPMDPRQWPQRTRVHVQVGITPGMRGHLVRTLGQQLQLQVAAYTQGGADILANLGTIYRTNMDMLRISGVDNPERYAVNPQSQGAQQAMQAAGEGQQEQELEDQARDDAEFQLEVGKVVNDANQHAGDLQFKYYDSNLDAAIEEAKIGAKGVIDMQKQLLVNEGKKHDSVAERRLDQAG